MYLTKFPYIDINGGISIKAIHNRLIGLELVLQAEQHLFVFQVLNS